MWPLRGSHQLCWVTCGPVKKWKVVDPLIAPSQIRLYRKIVWDPPLLAPDSHGADARLHLATSVPLVGSEAGTVLPTGIQEGHKIIARV